MEASRATSMPTYHASRLHGRTPSHPRRRRKGQGRNGPAAILGCSRPSRSLAKSQPKGEEVENRGQIDPVASVGSPKLDGHFLYENRGIEEVSNFRAMEVEIRSAPGDRVPMVPPAFTSRKTVAARRCS